MTGAGGGDRRRPSPPVARIISLSSARSEHPRPAEGVNLTTPAPKPPIIVVDGGRARTAVMDELLGAGWTLGDAAGDVRVMTVGAARDAEAVLLAALSGHGLVVRADDGVDSAVVDDLVDDLGRVRSVLVVGDRDAVGLDVDTWRLLHAMASGLTLTEAAQRLHLSLRTANRRLTDAKATFGVASRAQVLGALAAPGRIRPAARPG